MPEGYNHTIRWMKDLGMLITRENFIQLNWAGILPDQWTAEYENELPKSLQDWSLFELRGDELSYIGS